MEYELGNIQVTAEVQNQDNETIANLQDVTVKYDYLRDRPKEHVYAVFLKSDNEVIGDKLIGLGDANSAPFDAKDVARTAVLTNATAVILVHNHPSTNDTPTDTDLETTRDIQEALDLFGIELLDHVIISQSGSYSMKGKGDL